MLGCAVDSVAPLFPSPCASEVEHLRLDDFAMGLYLQAQAFLSFAGRVPPASREGDRIVILAGGHVPFVMRPTGDSCELVGPCYIHNMMDGEMFSKGQQRRMTEVRLI